MSHTDVERHAETPHFAGRHTSRMEAAQAVHPRQLCVVCMKKHEQQKSEKAPSGIWLLNIADLSFPLTHAVLGVDEERPEYDMDSEDEQFLSAFNARKDEHK